MLGAHLWQRGQVSVPRLLTDWHSRLDSHISARRHETGGHAFEDHPEPLSTITPTAEPTPGTGERKLRPLPGAECPDLRFYAQRRVTMGGVGVWAPRVGGPGLTGRRVVEELSARSAAVLTMFQHGGNKKCFTIESLVGKDGSNHGGGSGEEPIRPTALRFPDSLHPAAAAGVFGSCFQGSNGRTLFPDMVLQEPGTHAQGPGGLPLHPLQIPPQSFFSPQHRDALSFYPWVLRSRYLGHRFQGETGGGRVAGPSHLLPWFLSRFKRFQALLGSHPVSPHSVGPFSNVSACAVLK